MARILLIDDDECVRAVLAWALERAGHLVSQTRDGREGLRLLERRSFELVITDLVMPEVEGIEVLTEIRKRAYPVKVIAMSGGGRMSPHAYLHAAKLLGAAETLAKPFSLDEVFAAIEAVLPPQESKAVPIREDKPAATAAR